MNGTSTDQLIEAGKKLVEQVDTNAIARFVGGINSFFADKLGISLAEGATLIGKFFIWMFEAFIKTIQWALSLF